MPDLADVGFDRPKNEPLHDTVKLYHRHVLICTGRSDWPKHIDRDGGFGEALATSIAVRASEMERIVKLSACDEPSRTGSAAGAVDLLVFPDQVRYLGLRVEDLDEFVERHLVGGTVATELPHEPLTGKHLFVCTHMARDARCGVCGPPLAELFEEEIVRRGLTRDVRVRRTSHVGGHQFAGNVLIYPEGDWYGYVTPRDVPRIVEQHILEGTMVADLWRGRMGRN